MIKVNVNEICSSIRNAYLDTRTIMEPAGILSLAGAEKFIRDNKVQNKTFITICSGANMDFDRLRYISEHYDVTERLLYTQIPEEPGSFIELYKCINPLDISEFSYRYSNRNTAQILFSIKGNKEQLKKMYQKLEIKNFSYKILEEDYLSKMHLRYQIGNKLEDKNELLYLFRFPEKPGSLKHFLEALQLQWNISLFHYRKSGNTESSVLVGIQISVSDIGILEVTLDKIGYYYENHTDNFLYNKMLL
jgi:threonine dehydratase